MAGAEDVKRNSHGLRGTLLEHLNDGRGDFPDDDKIVLKFHGMYQGDNRDVRGARLDAGQELDHIVMLRCKLPGGQLTAEQYLELDRLAEEFGNQTLRITSRQGMQFHFLRKSGLPALIRRLQAACLTSWGACGDVNRNVMASPLPLHTSAHREAQALAKELAAAFAAKDSAYFEIWVRGEAPTAAAKSEVDPLYGETYLPRKFKIGIVVPPRNDIDIYTHDLGFVAHAPNGELEGYTLLAGGGMGMDHGKKETRPFLAQPVLYLRKEHAVTAARAALTIFRDFGNRENRKQARLKYLIAKRGLEWFQQELRARMGVPTEAPKPFALTTVSDWLGWHPQGDGRFFYGVRVEDGRIKDEGEKRIRSGLRTLVERLRRPLRLSPNSNLYLCDLAETELEAVEKTLTEHGIPLADALTEARRFDLACVGLPTCHLALSESERAFPKVMDGIDAILRELGLEKEPILFRMTGCPNGCVRPYTADFGFVGRGAGKYSFFAGGSAVGDRLGGLVERSIPVEEIPARVRPFLVSFSKDRLPGETFSAWWARTYPSAPVAEGAQFHTELAARTKA